jgi:hypothetical protein
MVIETTHAPRAESGHTHSALGRVTVLVEVDDGGSEKVVYERRWLDADAARRWCEEKIRAASDGTAVLEIQVTEEVWGVRHAWEATPSRHVPETLQLGMRGQSGEITWGSPYDVGSDPSRRRT